MPDVLFRTALEFINEFSAHHLAAAEVVAAYLVHNAAINAVVTLDPQGARLTVPTSGRPFDETNHSEASR